MTVSQLIEQLEDIAVDDPDRPVRVIAWVPPTHNNPILLYECIGVGTNGNTVELAFTK